MSNKSITLDQYLSILSKDVKDKMVLLQESIISIYPQVKKWFSYWVPAFKINNKLVICFATFKNHIWIYPCPSVIEFLKEKLKDYKASKWTIQLPLDEKLPIPLIIKFRINEIKIPAF
jgi:uncharacterized protein YdhG (YjbR/CyaY superfamily)